MKIGDRLAAVLLMLGAISCFAVIDAIAKLIGNSLHPAQVTWARFFFFLLPMLFLARPRDWVPTLTTGRPLLQLGRGIIIPLASLGVVLGAIGMPLAELTAILFLSPVLMTALSYPVLGERVDARGWVVTIVGFIGVLIVVRPGGNPVGWVVLWPIAATVMFTLYQLATRSLAATDRAPTTLAFTALVGAVATSLVVPFFWIPPTAFEWAMLVASGVFHLAGQICIVHAFSRAPAAVVAPVNYLQILIAGLLGFALFDELPDWWTDAGAAIIVGSGMMLFYRPRGAGVAPTLPSPTLTRGGGESGRR